MLEETKQKHLERVCSQPSDAVIGHAGLVIGRIRCRGVVRSDGYVGDLTRLTIALESTVFSTVVYVQSDLCTNESRLIERHNYCSTVPRPQWVSLHVTLSQRSFRAVPANTSACTSHSLFSNEHGARGALIRPSGSALIF